VINKSGTTSFDGSIDNFIVAQSHEIKMPIIVLGIFLHAFFEMTPVKYFSQIFQNKCASEITTS
jgi:hypothetical protein